MARYGGELQSEQWFDKKAPGWNYDKSSWWVQEKCRVLPPCSWGCEAGMARGCAGCSVSKQVRERSQGPQVLHRWRTVLRRPATVAGFMRRPACWRARPLRPNHPLPCPPPSLLAAGGSSLWGGTARRRRCGCGSSGTCRSWTARRCVRALVCRRVREGVRQESLLWGVCRRWVDLNMGRTLPPSMVPLGAPLNPAHHPLADGPPRDGTPRQTRWTSGGRRGARRCGRSA